MGNPEGSDSWIVKATDGDVYFTYYGESYLFFSRNDAKKAAIDLVKGQIALNKSSIKGYRKLVKTYESILALLTEHK